LVPPLSGRGTDRIGSRNSSTSRASLANARFLDRGWRKAEPEEPPHESSETVKISIDLLRREGIAERELAGSLGWTIATLRV